MKWVNLPGRDQDGVDPKSLTLQTYLNAVADVLEAETSPVVLVGHSFGGITISNAAESFPSKIKTLVYLSAYLPQNGESLLSLAQQDRDSLLGKPGNLEFNADYSVASIHESAKADVFANDAVGADRETIVASLIPEAAGPQGTPLTLSAENFGSVRKVYIETTKDQCVSPFLQEHMISNGDVSKVLKIDAGHAAFVTQPVAVANAIIETAETA